MELSLFAMGYANCTLTHPNGNIDEDSVRKRGFSTSGFNGVSNFETAPLELGQFSCFFERMDWNGQQKLSAKMGGYNLSMALWTCICFYITICRISRANHFVPSKREIWCQVGIMTYNTFTNTYINIYTGYSMDACRGYLKKWRVFFLFRFKMSSSHFILCFWHLYLFGFVMRCSDNVLTLLLDVERQRQEVALLIGSMIWIPIAQQRL